MPENQKPSRPAPPPPRGPIYRELLAKRFAAETDREKVLTSVIVAMADDIDKITRSIFALDRQDNELSIAVQTVAERVFGDAVGEPPGAAGAQQVDGEPRDQTPFPAGAAATPPTGNKTGPVDEEVEDLTPNAGSSAPSNVAPIPDAKAKGNGKGART